MSVQVEKLENNQAKFTIEASAEDFKKSVEKAYHAKKSKISMPGFRKGKVSRQIIEQTYGKEFFYEDAINIIIRDTFYNAADESGLTIVSKPDIDVIQVEEGKSLIYTAVVTLLPEVALGEYKGVEIEKIDNEVTEDEINKQLEQLREDNARIINIDDRPVQEGDDAIIDYEGSVDGVPFAGGKDTDHALTIGSHTFIDGFEEQIIGKSIGDEFDVNVTFPEQYHSEELAGKAAIFKVKLNGITSKELPELNDELAEDATEFDTLEAYKNSIKEKLAKEKEDSNKRIKEDTVISKVIENAQFDIPEIMIQDQTDRMIKDFENRMGQQGLTLEQYCMFTGQTREIFIDGLKVQAEKNIASRLVLEAIAKAENIQVSDEDLEKELEQIALSYKMEMEDVKARIHDKEKEQIKMDIAIQKAAELIVEQAKEV